MADIFPGNPFDGTVNPIFVHLKMDQHCLNLSEFIKLANSTSTIAKDISSYIFSDSATVEILVFPPEYGSFKLRLALALTIGATAISTGWSFLNSDIASAFIEGLTGYQSTYWAKEAGKSVRKVFDTTIIATEDEHEENINIIAGDIIAKCTTSFLAKDEKELNKIGLQKATFRKSYLAKNMFYETCIQNPAIDGVGFTEKDQFPIKRNNFPNKITEVPPPDDENKPLQWTFETRDIIIVSPTWERDGRRWQAQYESDGRKINVPVIVEDNLFWSYIEKKQLKPKILDNMRVQWAYILDGGKRKHSRVLNVMSYNGKKISKKLSRQKILELLGNYSESFSLQSDLFDNLD